MNQRYTMKHHIHAFLLIALSLAMPLFLAACATRPPLDENSPEVKEADAFSQNYYRTPDPARAIALLPMFKQWVEQEPDGLSWPMGGFYAGVVSTSPERNEEWTGIHDASDSPEWLKSAIDIGRASPEERTEIFDAYSSVMTPELLDFFWGWFFATGDSDAPRRIIRRGGIVDPPYACVDLTAGAARWSVLSLASEHPVVKDELNAYVRSATDAELVHFFDKIACLDDLELEPDSIDRILKALVAADADGNEGKKGAPAP